MRMHLLSVAVLLTAPALFADDSADRAKLNGAWQSQDEAHAVWTLEEQGAAIHISNSQGDKKLSEFVCNLGVECEIKEAGRKVKVTVYFNGPKLVVFETRGEEVFKRRFGMATAGDVLELETIPVVPDGKTETVHFTRLQTAAAQKP